MMSPEIEGPGAASLRRACEEVWSAALEWRRTVDAHWHSPRPPEWVPTGWTTEIMFAIGRHGLLSIEGDEDGHRITLHPLERSSRAVYAREATRLLLRTAQWYRWASQTTIAYSRSRAKARAAILEEARSEAAELLLADAPSQNGLAYLADKWATCAFGNVRARLLRNPLLRAPEWIVPPRYERIIGCSEPVYWWFERSFGLHWAFSREHGHDTPLAAAPDYLIADLLLLCRQAEEWLRTTQ